MNTPYKGKTGLPRLWHALQHSRDGLLAAWRHEDAFRMDGVLALVLLPAALLVETTAPGRALLVASVLLLLIVELLNSAVEAAVDHTSLEHHPLAKRAKDMGSAAVLLSLLLVVAVWGLVLLG